MQCEQVSDLVDAFALGALDEPERDAVARHLEGCADCRAHLEQAERLVASLAVATPLRRAPETLHSRLLTAIATGPDSAAIQNPADHEHPSPVTVTTLPRASKQPARRPWRVWPAGAAAAAVVLIAGAGGWIAALQMQVISLQNKSHVLEQGMSDVQGQHSALQLLASIGSSSVPMWPADSTAAQGTVIWNSMREECSVLASDLPPAPAGESYHVWLLGDGSRQGAWDEGPLSVATSGSVQKTIDLHQIPQGQGYEVVIMLQPRQSSTGERHPVLRATVNEQ
jgi:anti-sigma factor ChrR (cupin superfamily)